jgi:hypothetical protein
MKQLLVAVAALLLVPAAYGQAPVEMKASGTPGKATAERTVHLTATIKAVDVPGRTITLQNKAGETETFKAGPEIQRLEDLAVGDTVVIDYVQGLALEFQPAGSATVAPTGVVTGGRSDQAQPPGAAASAGVQATVTVTAIDSVKRLVSFQGPGGNVYQVKAGPKIHLEKLKVGDHLLATYVEALAIKVEKAPKK